MQRRVHGLGNKNVKNVLVICHSYTPGAHRLPLLEYNASDFAVFILQHSILELENCPVQPQQAVEAPRYIIMDTGQSPSNMLIGDDLCRWQPSTGSTYPFVVSTSNNRPIISAFSASRRLFIRSYEYVVLPELGLANWHIEHIVGTPDNWSESARASVEWWADARTEQLLLIAGKDELLLSSIESLAIKIKVSSVRDLYPNITYLAGIDDPPVAPIYVASGAK
ncbi:alpha/beta hydrolase fold protein [Penicillium macrosclerotiorum]|uniref:alpha/beta hydrolase fold protein n=1 Tax=Penicillium macrosclerotiorum TaxID=303699 RepID=UPI002547BA56|nr:alpha/beta hydrolase fold protein [Penicillium macrosclerotiorum]KAJ5679632.1 alpha/beta hydrolase fold protein [Penicillium macrosclerotiorum]